MNRLLLIFLCCSITFSALSQRGNSVPTAREYLEAGMTLWRQTYFDSAASILQQGIELVKENPDPDTEATLYNILGNVRREQNQYEEALRLYILAIQLFEEKKNQAGLAQALSNAGNMHNLMGNTDKALDYAQQSLERARAAGVKSSVAYSHRLLGRIYRRQGKSDDALKAYDQAIQLYRELEMKRELGETQLSIGNIFFDKKDHAAALKQYESALATAQQLPDTLMMAYVYNASSNALYYLKDLKRSKAYLDSAIVIATLKDLPTQRMDAYNTLSEIYAQEGNHKLSKLYYEKYVKLNDSITQVQNRAAAAELEVRYQTEKKDDAIRILNAENELKATQQKYLVVFVFLLVLVAVILYNRYTVKLRANKKLKALDEMKSRFFTNISHEFRTPLSLILGPLENKIERTTDPQEKENLQLMYRNASRLQNLINQLLDLSRIEAGSLNLHLEESDVAQTLRFIGSSFSSLAERKGIFYRQDIMPEFTGCYDRDKLEKITTKLISNAFKFTLEGGMVNFKAYVENDFLTVVIKDSGIGIPKAAMANIFNRFYQVDDSATRTSEGSGIGLALTKELAELHGGKLLVSSQEGVGSVFTFTIPVTRDAFRGRVIHKPEEKAAPRHTAEHIRHANDTIGEDESKPLLLLAEDNDDMQKFISDLLRDQYRILTTANGAEAFDHAQALVPDIVISDWMMPVMDGLALCEKLKTTDSTSHIPVLMLTARADQSSKLEGLEIGADDYLIKPFDSRELIVRLHNLIEQRRRLREVFSREVILQPKQISLPSRDADFLARVLMLVEEKYSEPSFSVEELAQEVNMSRMQLHRKMKALTDQSPGDFLRKYRLERAKQMLGVQGMQVSEVCFKTGFNNVSNFSRAFREYAGVTPSEFITAATAKT